MNRGPRDAQAEVDFVNRVGARAFEAGDYARVDEARDRAGELTDFREKVRALGEQWDELCPREAQEAEDEETRGQRRDLGRMRRGLRTPEPAFHRPILHALVELGGSAPMHEVLDRVGEAMQGQLKDVDHELLASSGSPMR